MKILYILPSLKLGGAEKLVVEMLPLFPKQKVQVDILLFDGSETPLKKQLRGENIKIFQLSNGGNVYNFLNIIRMLPYFKHYDIIHAHLTAPQLFTAICSLFSSVNIVTTEHSTNNRRRKLIFYRFIDIWMYKRFSKIICISERSKYSLSHYLHFDNFDKNIIVINNGISITKFAFPIKTKLGKYIVVTMVARFSDAKDQDTLIRAISLLPPNYILHLVGDGIRKKILLDLVANLHIKERVYFLGNRQDVPQLTADSDIIVLSSHWEGLSLASLEGLASGRPFIASDVDGLHDIVSGAGILFPEGDEKALSSSIKNLSENQQLYCQIAQQCIDRASHFDIHKTVEEYSKMYKEILLNK